MSMMEQQGIVDLYTNDDWDPKAKFSRLLIFSEHEHGAAPWIAAQSLVKDTKPHAHILSHLIDWFVFNDAPDPFTPGWDVYQLGDVLLLNVNEWPDTPLMPPEAAKATWLRVYPVVRDTLRVLAPYLKPEALLQFFTTTTMHDSLDPSAFHTPAVNELVMYDFVDGEHSNNFNDKSVFLSPPSWLFPKIGAMLGLDLLGSEVVISGHEPEARIDVAAAENLMDWLHTWGEVDEDAQKSFSTAVKNIQKRHDRFDDMTSEVERMMATLSNGATPVPKANNVMWG